MAELSVKTLEIDHREPLLTMSMEQLGKRKCYTDYRGASVSAQGGMDQEVVTCGWEGDALVIEVISSGGNRIVQRLRRLDEPLRLERISDLLVMSGGDKTLQVKQIFLPKDSLDLDGPQQQNSFSSDNGWMEQ